MISIEVLIEVVAQRHTNSSTDKLHIVVEILLAEQSLYSRFYALCHVIGKEVLFHNNGNDAVIVYLDGLFFQIEVRHLLSLTGDNESGLISGVTSHQAADEPAYELLDDDILIPDNSVVLNADFTLLKDGDLV